MTEKEVERAEQVGALLFAYAYVYSEGGNVVVELLKGKVQTAQRRECEQEHSCFTVGTAG